MSGHPPPPPPSRKPPQAVPIAKKPPAVKPPGAPGGPSGGHASYEHPEPQTTGPSTGMIIGIIGAILFVVIGIPVLICGGFIFYARQKTTEFVEHVEQEAEQVRQQEDLARQAEEQATLVLLTDRLYEQAKVDIGLHWTEPDGVRRRRWADWSARKVVDGRYEISGILQLGLRDAGTQTYNWACEYTTAGDPRSAQANWALQSITINGEQHYP